MTTRRHTLGAVPAGRDRVHVRVWAPDHDRMSIEIDGHVADLLPEGDGHFSSEVPGRAGSRYGLRPSASDRLYPDPASRWLPDGPEGLSAVVDLAAYPWRDHAWHGCRLPGQVIYEMHVGTCTPEGTWRAAERLLPELKDIGVTVIQMMPIAEFAGRFGWGYDGVQWFAPMHAYGEPSDFQHFVDAAHLTGLAVILDVVYNHLGPAGNVLGAFDRRWVSERHANEWGEALNFDGEGAAGMRALVLANVEYWVREFHVDGFRLDAAQQIFDESAEHILAALGRTARAAAAPREVIILAEHEGQDSRLLRPLDEDGYGLDGLYNEDFHHACRVTLTGVREAYLSDYRGTSREWLSLAQHGFLFQGQYYPWQQQNRGTAALDRPPHQFVCFLENHDQVANSAAGRRLSTLTSPAWWRAMSAYLLLGPWTPMIFQGQEDGSTVPFEFFADHEAELQAAVVRGRLAFLAQFARLTRADGDTTAPPRLDDPCFARCRSTLDVTTNEAMRALYKDLLHLRRTDPALGQHAHRLIGSTVSDRTLLLRFIGADAERLLVINLDADLNLAALPDPLVAPPSDRRWSLLWCSEARHYGGTGIAATTHPHLITATGHAATVFAAVARETS
ncbi:MAG: DUF3459 domain-containing protein [Acidobacteria bacterium]|nr:DUF3459 domain-containing protein [Acidobacteriota bacterium]